jgi:uncharacterized protein YndB with AHSA1/START domain
MANVDETTGRRSVELEFDLPGTPEQVWQAIATGPGITCWFVPSEVEERKGGKVAFHPAGNGHCSVLHVLMGRAHERRDQPLLPQRKAEVG